MASRLGRVTTNSTLSVVITILWEWLPDLEGLRHLKTSFSDLAKSSSGNGFQTWKGYDRVGRENRPTPRLWEWLPDLEGLRHMLDSDSSGMEEPVGMASRLGRVTTELAEKTVQLPGCGNGFQTWKGYDLKFLSLFFLVSGGNGFQTWKGYDTRLRWSAFFCFVGMASRLGRVTTLIDSDNPVFPDKWEWLPDLEGLRLHACSLHSFSNWYQWFPVRFLHIVSFL